MNGTVGSKPTDDDRMISACKRPLRVPQFKEAKDKVFWISFPPSKSEAENAYSQEFFCIVGVRDIVFYASDDCHPLNYHVPFDV
uniref:Ovule protein n=1 Tax=Heterorhabditis bacteriophora TaxID=37862 RepID=A0A1I7WVY1_HETBA